MDPLRLIPDDGGEVIIITTHLVLIGRDPICDIQLADVSVSRQHAEIRLEDDRWLVRDLNSANGVMVDGKQTPRSLLLHGQRLQFGSVGFRVETDQGGEHDGATVVLARPAVKAAARGHQESDNRPTMAGSARVPREAPKSRRGLIIAVAALGLLAIAAGFWLRGRSSSEADRATARTAPTTASGAFPNTSPATTPRPSPSASPTATAPPSPTATPSPTPTTTPAPAVAVATALPRGVIVISTDARATILVDGQPQGVLPAGGFRRVEVAPGEHIVTFEVGKQRRDILVRTNANEQAVARFEIRSLRTAPPAPTPRRAAAERPRPQATPPPTQMTPRPAAAATAQAPAPTVPPATPTPPRASTPPRIVDAGLAKGAAATARADYYRALLILNDAVRRLENDPQGGADLVIAHAYLAWTYHGLGRTADAQNSAQRALRLDSGVAAKLGAFPAPVLDLFKASR